MPKSEIDNELKAAVKQCKQEIIKNHNTAVAKLENPSKEEHVVVDEMSKNPGLRSWDSVHNTKIIGGLGQKVNDQEPGENGNVAIKSHTCEYRDQQVDRGYRRGTHLGQWQQNVRTTKTWGP